MCARYEKIELVSIIITDETRKSIPSWLPSSNAIINNS